MKTTCAVLAAAVMLLAGGCAGPGKFAVELKSETPNLGIDNSARLPLSLAVMVPDPMGYTITYIGAKGYRRDMTADFREGRFLLEREMAKVASETFPQAFRQVVVVRELPQPGQYDAIVRLDVGKISMLEVVRVTGESCDVTTEWSMSLLDKGNREVLGHKDVYAGGNFTWSVINPGPGFMNGTGPIMSKTVTHLVKESAKLAYGSEALRKQAAAGAKP